VLPDPSLGILAGELLLPLLLVLVQVVEVLHALGVVGGA